MVKRYEYMHVYRVRRIVSTSFLLHIQFNLPPYSHANLRVFSECVKIFADLNDKATEFLILSKVFF